MANPPTPSTPPTAIPEPSGIAYTILSQFYAVLSVVGTVGGAAHGYARNGTVWGGVKWAILGGLFPYITVPIAFMQGFGKPAGAPGGAALGSAAPGSAAAPPGAQGAELPPLSPAQLQDVLRRYGPGVGAGR